MTKPAPTRTQFTITVFPHVKKFIEKTSRSAGVIKSEEYTILGKLITLALRDTRGWKDPNNKNFAAERLTEKITIRLTNDQSKMGPRISKLLRINADMDRVFKDHLLQWIAAQGAVGIPAHASCKSFLLYYDLEETEYSLASAYKCWQRSQNEGERAGFRAE